MRGPNQRSRILAAAIALALLVVVAYWHWWSSRGVSVRPTLSEADVLLVTIDTLRADRVGPVLTPSLEALAARGVRFTEARAPAPLTLPAHASLMTGVLPPGLGVRLNGVHRLARGTTTLAQTLQSAGYHTAAFVGAYVLDSRFGLDQGFDHYDDEIPRGADATGSLDAERRGDIVVARAIAWLQSLPDDEKPFFLWVHLYDPHAPYAPPPEWLARANGQAYDGEVAFADAQVGVLFDAIGAVGRGDRTLTIVAGDHGESLGEHGEVGHGMLLYESALRIPFIIAAPGVPAAVRHDPVSLVDVVPTVLGMLGLTAPPRHDGRDLFTPGAEGAVVETYAETQYPEAMGCSPLYALTDGRWKYIGGPAVPELYDLTRDPSEERDLAPQRRATVDAMHTRVATLLSGTVRSTEAEPSAEIEERLRALGYVGTAPSPAADGQAPSPVTMVGAWSQFQTALADLHDGEADRATGVLAPLVEQHPDALVFRYTYARALLDYGRVDDALAAYRGALDRWPRDTALLHAYAMAARRAGLVDEAMKAEQVVLALDPDDAAAHNGMGLLFVAANRPADARAAFERAVALDPNALSYWVNLGNARLTGGDQAGAEAAYREALRLEPSSIDAANGLAVLLVNTGRGADAVPWLERVVAASPEFYEAWLNLGMALTARGERARAADAYRRVLAAPPGFEAQRQAAQRLIASLGDAGVDPSTVR